MAKFTDLSGKTFGRLLVQSRAENKLNHSMWNCLCECGNSKVVRGGSLKQGGAVSCGCYGKEVSSNHFKSMWADENFVNPAIKHGMSDTDTYRIWWGMVTRCYNSNDTNFPHYGAKGIEVYGPWREDFTNFLKDIGERPSKEHSLERIKGSENYCPGNVKWATDVEQARNRAMQSRNTSGKTGVNFMKGKNRWLAHYSCPVQKKMIAATFSVKIYGYEEAFRLACEWRDARISEINNQGAGYSDYHGK